MRGIELDRVSERGGVVIPTQGGACVFREDDAEALHGLMAVVPPPSSEGIGVRVRLRPLGRPACAVWVRGLGDGEDIREVTFDLSSSHVAPVRSGPQPIDAAAVEVEPGLFDLWVAVANGPAPQGYRIDLLARQGPNGGARYSGEGRPAFALKQMQVTAPAAGLLELHAELEGYAAHAHIASVPEYYSNYFTEAKLQSALSRGDSSRSATEIFETLMAESTPRARLSLRDLAEPWLAEAGRGIAIDMDSTTLLAALRDEKFRRQLCDHHTLRAAIEIPFPSDLGAAALRRVLFAERSNGAVTLEPSLMARAPRLMAAELFSAFGLEGARPYLPNLGASAFCFDPYVLTRPYCGRTGGKMERVGLMLLSAKRFQKRQAA